MTWYHVERPARLPIRQPGTAWPPVPRCWSPYSCIDFLCKHSMAKTSDKINIFKFSLRWTVAAKTSNQRTLNHWLLTFLGGYKTTIEPSAWYDITHTWTQTFSLFETFITRASPDPSTTLYFLRWTPYNTSVTSSTLCGRTVSGSFDWNPYSTRKYIKGRWDLVHWVGRLISEGAL